MYDVAESRILCARGRAIIDFGYEPKAVGHNARDILFYVYVKKTSSNDDPGRRPPAARYHDKYTGIAASSGTRTLFLFTAVVFESIIPRG